MLLKRLVEYSEHIPNGIGPLGYDMIRVKWRVTLDLSGRCIGKPIPMTGEAGREDWGKRVWAPSFNRTSNPDAKLIVDDGRYVFGRIVEDSSKTQERHDNYMTLLRQCTEVVKHPALIAVISFLEQLPDSMPELNEDFNPKNNFDFRIETPKGDIFPIQLPEIQKWWTEYLLNKYSIKAYCASCSSFKPCMRVHHIPIRGIPPKLGSKLVLVSTNQESFHSHMPKNKDSKEVMDAPVCLECVDRYSKTLNYLLASKSHSYRLRVKTEQKGRSKSKRIKTRKERNKYIYIYWTREPTEFNFLEFLDNPDSEQFAELLNSLYKGLEYKVIDPSEFYATALMGRKSRVIQLEWLESTVGKVKQNLGRWFRRQKMVDAGGREGHPLGITSLVASLYREIESDLDDEVPRLMIRSALTDTALPKHLLIKVVTRIKANPIPRIIDSGDIDNHSIYARMMLIRLVFNSYPDKEENYMSELDTKNQDPAYLCGRLLAVLEQIQLKAIGGKGDSKEGPKATIIERYYGAASTIPGSVFGTLIRLARTAHLPKLLKGKDSKGIHYNLENQMMDIIEILPSKFPSTLNMKEQAIFALGYYHQRADDRAKARAHAESKKNSGEILD